MSSRTPTVQTRVQCNENSTRSYGNPSVSKFVKTAINTATTVKLLKSKVTLLNTWEKLKMTYETQCDLGNKSKVNKTLLWNISQLGENPRNGYGDKIRNGWELNRPFINEFFRLFTFLCFQCKPSALHKSSCNSTFNNKRVTKGVIIRNCISLKVLIHIFS
jgi:hypothetical protein